MTQRGPGLVNPCSVCGQLTTGAKCSSCYRRIWFANKKNGTTRKYVRKVTLEDETPEAIEALYQAAMVEIRRRPREEPDLRWTSPLHGLKGTGL